jgi:ABC-type bacteriocin/lantibiotic exporter with double-glycine peptidase domain
MRFVKQKHKCGCAIACIAMLCGIGYNSALEIVHPKRNPRDGVETTFETFLRSLARCNKDYKINFTNLDLNKLKNNACIMITVPNKGFRHAVVWDAKTKKILDPANPKIRKSFYQKNLSVVVEIIS